MACITTINATPVPSVTTTALSQTTLPQNALSVTNNQVSGALTIPMVNSSIAAITTVTSAPITVNSSNSVPSSINVNILPQENSQALQVLSKQRLQELVREVDPNVNPDDDVEELLLQLAEDFIDDVVTTSCRFAKHRKSNMLEVKDVQLSLVNNLMKEELEVMLTGKLIDIGVQKLYEKNWNMWIPGFGCEELRPYKKSAVTDAHKQRMALIRKAKK